MKVTIDFETDELQAFIQDHLETGIKIQTLIRAAVCYYQTMRIIEKGGHMCGYGSKDRFKQYNTEVSPAKYLEEAATYGPNIRG